MLQSIVDEVNARLAADPGLAREVLKDKPYANGQRNARLAAMEYGNALEKLVAAEITKQGLDDVLIHIGGPDETDFEGCGKNYDTHTENMREIRRHQRRRYQPVSVTYTRPKALSSSHERVRQRNLQSSTRHG